jgi:valyl-tRNA synthetase
MRNWDHFLRLARLSEITFGTSSDISSVGLAPVSVDMAVFALDLSGLNLAEAGLIKLQKELEEFEIEIAKLKRQLDNSEFMAKAKPEVILKRQESLKKAEENREQAHRSLSQVLRILQAR